jgi:hypothetical protein
MKTIFIFILSLVAMLALAMTAPAQIVSPTSVLVTSDTDVLNFDPVFATDAYLAVPNFFGGPTPAPATVNNVTFTTNLTQNGVTMSLGGGFPQSLDFEGYGTNGGSDGLSSTFNGVLTYLLQISDNPNAAGHYSAGQDHTGSLTFSGLTPGQVYTLQLFAGGQPGLVGGTETITDTANSSSGVLTMGAGASGDSYILDVFTAAHSGSETIDISPLTGGGYFAPGVFFNAVNLEAGVVPEPSTTAMLLAGGLLVAAGLVISRRRRLDY